MRHHLRGRALLALFLPVLALTACSSADPTRDTTSGAVPSGGNAEATSVVVGSQAYYSNEIIAEIFAQALEGADLTVTREYQIGQREVYMPELESGAIDVMPEYTGNLLQYYDSSATSGTPEEVAQALADALPEGLHALPFAQATDQDSFTVTRAFAQEHALKTLADLASVGTPLKIAANSEFETRPYGPQGLKSAYGIDVEVVPVEDSGGPLTVKALTDGTVQLADIYSSDPAIRANDLVTLEDPESLVLPQNVVPIVSPRLTARAKEALGRVTDALTTQDLIALNTRSVAEQKTSAEIASVWLEQKGLD